jgi:hypothetical protein
MGASGRRRRIDAARVVVVLGVAVGFALLAWWIANLLESPGENLRTQLVRQLRAHDEGGTMPARTLGPQRWDRMWVFPPRVAEGKVEDAVGELDLPDPDGEPAAVLVVFTDRGRLAAAELVPRDELDLGCLADELSRPLRPATPLRLVSGRAAYTLVAPGVRPVDDACPPVPSGQQLE